VALNSFPSNSFRDGDGDGDAVTMMIRRAVVLAMVVVVVSKVCEVLGMGPQMTSCEALVNDWRPIQTR